MNNIFNWPFCVSAMGLVIAVLFMVFFRKEIGQLVGRINRINKDGIEANGTSVPVQTGQSTPQDTEKLFRAFDSVLLLNQEQGILDDAEFKKVPENKRVEVLARHLAATQLALLFERVDKLIYGSQISILEFLNQHPEGMPLEQLKSFYDVAVKQNPNLSKYAYQSYIAFLKNFNLVTESGDRLLISLFGNSYLVFITARGYRKIRDY